MDNLIPIKINKVLELEGVNYKNYKGKIRKNIYACIHQYANKEGTIQYALLTIPPSHGIAYLGRIDPKTKKFKMYNWGEISIYLRAENGVICKIFVPKNQLSQIKTIESILSIPEIEVVNELFPKEML